ncbi:hypothetical protein [Salinispora cortesiana]|uniref:hypothetical protein n=1 Tax=Salinispora cortesiana TaxID=1305843 RepID=UPI00041CFF0A|nr:hypothetical protein [Salinispora cortesiana]
MSRHRVLLVRPWGAGRADSGCCSGAGIISDVSGRDPGRARQLGTQRPLGEVYLTVRAGLPTEVEVEVVNPDNTLFLLPAVVRDGRRHGRPWRVVLRQLARATGYAAIIVDGRVVSDATAPTPERALRLIRQALDAPRR